MSRFLELGAAGGTVLVLLLAYYFADRNITPIPDLPDRSAAVAALTAPVTPVLAAVAASGEAPGTFGLGRAALPEEIAAWDIDVRPDGLGLPVGSGSVLDGEVLFTDNCASCHGDFGEGVGRWPVLAGGFGSLTRDRPVKTVGSYWPYLSTVFDYVQRAMPFGNAQSLSPDEIYAITAYILNLNDLVDEDFVLSNANFTDVAMTNTDNFILDDRPETELSVFTGAPCMAACKDVVEITARARVIDVTPDGAGVAGDDLEGAGPLVEVAVAEPPAAAAATPEPAPDRSAAGADPALIAAGAKVFKKCQACHQVGDTATNRAGPQLNGVVGRAAASVEGFRYSTALTELAQAGLIWTEAALDEFLTNPKVYAQGTKMSFAGLRSEADRAAVTAYLETFGQ